MIKKMTTNLLVESALKTDLESATPQERVAWAVDMFGDDLIMTTSFGDAFSGHVAFGDVGCAGYSGGFH